MVYKRQFCRKVTVFTTTRLHWITTATLLWIATWTLLLDRHCNLPLTTATLLHCHYHIFIMASSAVMTYADICRVLNSTQSSVRWCRAKSLLPTSHDCECGCDCRIVRRPRYPEGECFRCPRKGCQKVSSFRTGTFFENSNLPLEKIIRLIHLWSTVTPLNKMKKELDVRV